MAVMYSFCFWFSVRLGSIIVGATSLVQAVGFLILCCIGLGDIPQVSKTLNEWVEINDLLFLEEPLQDMAKDPEPSLIIFTTFAAIYTFSCLLLIYGSYRCNVMMIYPFMGMDFIRLVFLSICFLFTMILVKQNLINLGLLIAFCVGGGFLLLYLFYMWSCTLSLCQVVSELEKMEEMEEHSVPEQPTFNKKLTLETPLAMGMNYNYENGYNYLTAPIY